jgi:hypothetical protein
MSILDNGIDQATIENLRRSIVELPAPRPVSIDRARALRLVDELGRLHAEHQVLASQLQAVLHRLERAATG